MLHTQIGQVCLLNQVNVFLAAFSSLLMGSSISSQTGEGKGGSILRSLCPIPSDWGVSMDGTLFQSQTKWQAPVSPRVASVTVYDWLPHRTSKDSSGSLGACPGLEVNRIASGPSLSPKRNKSIANISLRFYYFWLHPLRANGYLTGLLHMRRNYTLVTVSWRKCLRGYTWPES